MVGSSFNPRPQSINEVVDYVLKRLGVQLLEINVTEEQILDRISDAVVYFQEHHADGSFEGYFKTKITPTKLVISPSIASSSASPSASTSPSLSYSPSASHSISSSPSLSPSASASLSPSSSSSASTSASVSPSSSESSSSSSSLSPSASPSPSHSISPSASISPSNENKIEVSDIVDSDQWCAKVYSVSNDQSTIEIHYYQPKEPDSEIKAGQVIHINGYDFSVVSVTLGNPELGYVEIPKNVDSIIGIGQLPAFKENNLVPGRFDPFKTWTNQIFHYKGSGLAISFYLQEVRNETLTQLNTLQPWADFNRYMNRAYLNAYDYNKNIGNWLVFRVITVVDPEEFPKMYGDTWFLRYCVELVRRQWGENLEKYDEVALLNGVKVNGAKMRSLADERIKALEEEMWSTYRTPDDFFLA